MGNQNSSGVPGDRSRTPVLGRRKNSTSGLFRAASSTLTRSVPVTPAGTPASIRSEKTGFFRKFRRNKNRSRSDSMASINSISSTASTVSHGYPGRGFEDNVSRDSQSSLAMNSSIVGDCGPVHTMAGTAPLGLNTATPTGSVNVPAPPHSFKQQATILQPISERPNETYQAQMNSLHSDLSPKNGRYLAEKIPDHISDASVAQRSLSLIKKQDGTTGSNLTLTDDGSEYLTASETDLSRGSAGKNGDSIKGFNCDNYKVTSGTHSHSVVSEQMRNKPDIELRTSSGQVTHFVDSSGDGVRSNTNIELLHERSAGSLVPDQVPYHGQHKSQGENSSTASAKSKKSDKKKTSTKAKQEKKQASNQSKTYAAVLGTGLFIANFSDSVSKDSATRSAPDVTEPRCASPKCVTFSDSTDSASDTHHRVNFPSQPAPAAPVCQVESTDLSQVNDNYSTKSLPRSFAAAVVNSPSASKRVVQAPRGPFGSLTRKESSSSIESDTVVFEAEQMPLTQGLHGKLPVAVSKHGMRTSHKPVNEPIVHPQSISLSTQAPPPQNTGNYKNVRPRTFATVAGQGGGKGQRGVKTVPGGNAGSPATTPDGSGGVLCHSLPRSTLSSAGSAPALGVCGARLRAAKAHSVQQLNATRSPPMSPTKHPEHSPFVGTSSSLPQQAKSMPQLAGRIICSKDDSAVPKVKSVESVKVVHVEASSLPRLASQRTKLVTLPKPTAHVTKGKIAVSHVDGHKGKDGAQSSEKYSNNLPALVINEPTDQVNVVDDKGFEAKHHETMRGNVSGSGECVSESSGSLHRLNTNVQFNTQAKNDKAAKSEKQPVTQISHKEPTTAAKSRPDGILEMPSKVPMHTQKVCPPGQSISTNVGEEISTGNVEQNSSIDSVRQSKSTISNASKLPTSSPNKQRSVANDIKSPESAFNQDQTKQLVVNANIAPVETTKIDTSNLQVKHETSSAPKIQIQKSQHISSQSTAVSVEIGSTSGNNRIPSENVGCISDVQESSNAITPTDEEQIQSAISTVDSSKQENKSGSAPEESQSPAPAIRTVDDASANTTKNQPVSEPRNDLTKDDEEQQKEASETSQSAEEVAVVTSQSQVISKISETSQHEKLTIGVSGNLEHQKHTSVSKEKAPKQSLEFITEKKHFKPNNADPSISNNRLKGTDATKDESADGIMGSGESKVVEDEVEKVARGKPSQNEKSALQEGKYNPDGGITGVSDKGRSNEKVGTITSDSTTVKGSQLPVKTKTQPEANNLSKLPRRGDGAAQRPSGHGTSSPQVPPRSHRPGSDKKSQKEAAKHQQQQQQKHHHQKKQQQQQQQRNDKLHQPKGQNVVQKDQRESEAVPTVSLRSESLGNAEASTVKNKVPLEVKHKQSVVEIPANNSVTRRDGSDKISCPGEKRIATESAEKTPKVVDQTSSRRPEVDKQSGICSADISRTVHSSIAENNTTSGGTNISQEPLISNINESKPSKMEGASNVPSELESESVTKKSPVNDSSHCKLDADIKADDPNIQISLVTEDTAINSKQGKQTDKQNKPVDKHAVNIVERKDVQVPGLDTDQENRPIVSDNDTCEGSRAETGGSSGSKPRIFDEMISVKDVNIPSETSSAFTSLEMDEKIQNDNQGAENSTACMKDSSSEVEASLEGSVENRTEIKELDDKQKETAKKVKISIEQTESAPEEVLVCNVTTKPKIITEEEVTFTIDIPAECARSGKAKPEVNVYISATCIAVTSTSGTVNTTAQLGGNETTTSVSADGQAVMSVSSGPGLPLTSATAGGEPLSSHRKDETPLNICVDGAPSTVREVVEGSAEVKHAGQQEAGKLVDPAVGAGDEAASGAVSTDVNVHTQQVEGLPEIVVSNEPANDMENDKGRSDTVTLGSQATSEENSTSASNNEGSCTSNEIEESSEMAETRQVQHMDVILSKVNVNAQFGSPKEKSTPLSGGNHSHSDKPSPTQSEEIGGIAEQHAAASTADPISISKASESERAHSTEFASREGGGCDPGNPDLIVEEISVSRVRGGTDTASINNAPQIAITAEIANKDSVVESTPAECNVNNSESVNLTDYLAVDDRLRLRRVESDSSSIGRLIHSSEGEHSDINLDDILVRNMEECNIKVNRFGSESSGNSDSESDAESSAKESESEEDNNKINSHRKGPHTVNDSDLSDDMCDKLKASKKIENVEETSSDDESDGESSESEDEKPKKKCITDEENHIKPREDSGAKSPDDCYATKLENMGHKVGEAYFITRRRKRAKMVDRETITQSTHEVQCPEVCHVSTDTFDSVLISSSGSSDTSPSRVQWEDDSVDELDAGPYEYYSDEDGEWEDDYSDGSVYSDDEDSQLGATAAGPVKVIYSRPRPRLDSPREHKGFQF